MAITKREVKRSKIDTEGQYLPFPGVTVVAHVKNRTASDSPFQAFYDILSSDSLVRQYFSPLPSSSYHMTTFNLFVQGNQSDDSWNAFLLENRDFFEALNAYLTENALEGMRLTVDSLYSKRAISIKVHIPEALQEQLETMSKIFSDHSLSSKIPPYFHVTIAYRYRPCLDKDMEAEIQRRINEPFAKLFHKNRVHELEPHGLCSFDSMLAFKPWTGSVAPSLARPSVSAVSVFSQTDKKTPESTIPTVKLTIDQSGVDMDTEVEDDKRSENMIVLGS